MFNRNHGLETDLNIKTETQSKTVFLIRATLAVTATRNPGGTGFIPGSGIVHSRDNV